MTYIKNNLNNCKIVTYENIISEQKFVFDFIMYDKINIKKLDSIVKNMLLFLQVLIKISNNETKNSNICCKNGLHLTIFLTPFQKKLDLRKMKEQELEFISLQTLMMILFQFIIG